MGVGKKFDHPPLLGPGAYLMSLPDLERLLLSGELDTQRRRYGFQKIEEVVQILLRAKFKCELWIDGSLLTRKPDPGDVDLSIVLDHDVLESMLPEQREIYNQAAVGELLEGVDSDAHGRFPRGHPHFGNPAVDTACGLGDLYGQEHSEEWLKGYVILRLGENDVGLRICS